MVYTPMPNFQLILLLHLGLMELTESLYLIKALTLGKVIILFYFYTSINQDESSV